ncbi:MAG: hypothetical protein ABMA14_09760 [Hyphomonadaceae bacterium]
MSKSIQHPQKAPTAAQRANEANRAQQMAVNGKAGRPSDRKATQEGEISDQGMVNDQRPAGLARKN